MGELPDLVQGCGRLVRQECVGLVGITPENLKSKLDQSDGIIDDFVVIVADSIAIIVATLPRVSGKTSVAALEGLGPGRRGTRTWHLSPGTVPF